ncbi:MAG TPA: cysteine dioxygenase family protein [Polyangia bacterium]|nr:cysteine dioxygenase family protein [Polyangia bacterium]
MSAIEYSWSDLLMACRAGALGPHLRASPLPVEALLSAAPPPGPGLPYGRLPIFRDAVGEVLLVGWREETFCAPHDHGDAGGFVHLLRGRLVERHWRWRMGDLCAVSERTHAASEVVAVGPRAIHDMKASDAAVGIHFYFPPIQGMQVFDRLRRETLVVSEDCGAWIPQDDSLVLSRARWP